MATYQSAASSNARRDSAHVKSMAVMIARMSLTMHTAAERPDLWERGIASESVWPEYNLHGDVLNRWWGHLDEELPDFQFVLYDEAADEVVAEGHTGPLWWDGHDETLPPVSTRRSSRSSSGPGAASPSTRCARSPRRVRVPAATAASPCSCSGDAHDCGAARSQHLVAPVRPSLKERYPMTDIEQYVTYRRADGQLLVRSWMRVHERLGARVFHTAAGVAAHHGHRDGVGVLDQDGLPRDG